MPSQPRHSAAVRIRAGSCIGLAFWAVLAAPAAAAAPASTPEASTVTTEPAQPATNPLAESTRQTVRSATVWLARSVDGWFGDQPFEDGGEISNGRISLSLLKRQGESLDTALRFSVHLRLPNAERYPYVFLGRDDPRDVITDKPTEFSRQQRITRDRADPPSFVAGLGLNLPNSVALRVGFRGGLKPFAQARYTRDWVLPSGTSVDFRETVFWAQSDRFGSTSALSLEHALSPTLALRWLASATITQASPKFAMSSTLGAYQSFARQRLLTWELLMDGTPGAGIGLSDYGTQVKWQQPVYRDWLLIEVLGGQFWPRHDAASPRTRAWALGSSLKMRF